MYNNKMKKILLILNEAPLPDCSAAGKWYYYFISNLMKQTDVKLKVLASCAQNDHVLRARTLFPEGEFFLYPTRTGLFSKVESLFKPFSYMFSPEMKKRFDTLSSEDFDVIHFEQVWSLWLMNKSLENAVVSVHYLNHIDQSIMKHDSLKGKMISWLQKFTEKKLLRRAKFIKTCSENLKKEIYQWFPEKNYYTIPFVIDPRLFSNHPQQKKEARSIVLVGSMDWPPSFLAARRLMIDLVPAIKKSIPDLKVQIVGWNAKKQLEKYNQGNQIEIFENVPNIGEYFLNNSLMVYPPEVGSGNKIKLQEAILYQLPILTTDSGIEGLEKLKNKSIIVKNTNNELIEEAINLLNNLDHCHELAIQAKKEYLNEYSIDIILKETTQMYQEIISSSLKQ